MIVSGESGAGKSESMKLVLQYLAEKSGATIRKKKEGEKAAKEEASLQEQILQSNPVMEAFGNAKTVRNNNSSRFGKWIEVKFNGTGQISNGHIINYLLEKSRVVYQSKEERNFHMQIMTPQSILHNVASMHDQKWYLITAYVP